MHKAMAMTALGESSLMNRARTWTMILIVFGILVSGYLTYVKLTGTPMVCVQGSIFNCDKVQSHPIGHLRIGRVIDIPIAVLGFGMYLSMAAIHVLQPRVALFRQYGYLMYFLLLLFGWMYSMYLVFAQVVIIQGLCMWCLMHELNIYLMLILSISRTRKFMAGDIDA